MNSDLENPDLEQDVISPSYERRFFTIVPNIIIESNLSNAAKILYLWYMKVCGVQGNRCYQSLSTLAKGTNLSIHTLIKVREELEEAGFIDVQKVQAKNGSTRIVVSIIDVWDKNNEKYRVLQTRHTVPDGLCKRDKVGTANETIAPLQTRHTNKNTVNKNPEKKNQRGASVARRTPLVPNLENGNGHLPERLQGPPKELAAHLRGILVKYHEDLVENRNPKLQSFAQPIYDLIHKRKVEPERIKRVLDWMDDHYAEEFTPKVHKVDDLLTNFRRFEDSMKRWYFDQGEEMEPVVTVEDRKREGVIRRVRNILEDRGKAYPYKQPIIDGVLTELGHAAGYVKTEEL